MRRDEDELEVIDIQQGRQKGRTTKTRQGARRRRRRRNLLLGLVLFVAAIFGIAGMLFKLHLVTSHFREGMEAQTDGDEMGSWAQSDGTEADSWAQADGAGDDLQSGEGDSQQGLSGQDPDGQADDLLADAEAYRKEMEKAGTYPPELLEHLEENAEILDFAKGYDDRKDYIGKPIDISGECVPGEVPLLMQWDRRWGYDPFGSGMIGLDGCGPTCLSMAYIYFTGDTTKTPREMARFAFENGYYASGKTTWKLWEEGVELLGMRGAEIPLDENRMKQVLDRGGLIVCTMKPGDFTTGGHFILITGYDDGGFHVNDPNRRSNSEKQWSYDELQWQIKNLWSLNSLETPTTNYNLDNADVWMKIE